LVRLNCITYLEFKNQLFDRLVQYANNKTLDQITKLRLSYGLIKNLPNFQKHSSIKRYLHNLRRSGLIKAGSIDWEIALFFTSSISEQPKERVGRILELSQRKKKMDIGQFLATDQRVGGLSRQNRYEVFIYTDSLFAKL